MSLTNLLGKSLMGNHHLMYLACWCEKLHFLLLSPLFVLCMQQNDVAELTSLSSCIQSRKHFLISSSCKLMELAVQRSAILFLETVSSTWEMFLLQGETHSQRTPMQFPWPPLLSCIAATLIVPSPHLCVADYCRRSVVTNWLVPQDFVVANWSHKILSWSSFAPLPCIQSFISPLGLHVASHHHLCAFYWSL